MTVYFKQTPAATSATGLPTLLTAATASPVASFTTTISRNTVTFNAAASSTGYSGGIRRYFWDFGNGRFAEGQTVSNTYRDFGSYTVKLTITDAAFRTASTTQTVALVPTVADTFNRADATSLGSAASGATSKPWVAYGSTTMGVKNQQATPVAGSGTSFAAVDVGKTGGAVQLDFSVQGNTHNRVGLLVFRAVDINNFFFVQSYFPPNGYAYRMIKKVAGTNTVLQALDQTPTQGDRHRIEDDGSTIQWYINDMRVKTITGETSLNTATKVGLGGAYDSDPLSSFDNFCYWSN